MPQYNSLVPRKGLPHLLTAASQRRNDPKLESVLPLPVRWCVLMLWTALLLLLVPCSNHAAEYTCYNLTTASLPGKTLWIRIETGTVPYEIAGSYRILLNPNGTYAVPTENGVAPRTGKWTATAPGGQLILRLTGFMSDTIEDVLVLFGGCQNGAACTSCGYALTREGVPGLQAGTYTLTDGEAPSPIGAPVVTAFIGGGVYPAGANIFLSPQVNGNPNSYKVKWYRDDVLIAGASSIFMFVNDAQPDKSGVYRAEISNANGTNKVSTRVTIHPTTEPVTHLGRPWVKIVDDQTLLPGTALPIGNLGPRSVSLRDGKILIQSASTTDNGLLRWQDGKMETVVATGTSLPGGLTVQSLVECSEDSAGVVNFYARHSAGYGLFEIQGSTILQIAGVGSSVPGAPATTFTGFQWLSRRNGKLVYVGYTSANKAGIFLWDGNASTPLLVPGEDLPGLLGPIQQVLSLRFDGDTVVMQVNDSVLFQGNNRQGIYRRTLSTPWKEITNATQPPPDIPSTVFKIFNGVDVAGGTVFFTAGLSAGYQMYAADPQRPPRFVAPSASSDLVTAQFSAANPLNVYLRNYGSLSLLGNGLSERILGPDEIIDGKKVSEIIDVDAQDINVVVTLQFSDGTRAVYAALGDPVTNIPLILNSPVFSQGKLNFTIKTVLGVTYQVEFLSKLSTDDWEPKQSIEGDGSTKTVSVDTTGAVGFYRVSEVVHQ